MGKGIGSVSHTTTSKQKEDIKIDTQSLKNFSESVKSVAKKLSPSVVSIIVSKDIQTYRTDPYGFFYEPSGTVRKKVGGGT
jgi:isopentenyl phosphate kinase